MKTLLQTTVLLSSLCVASQASQTTLTVNSKPVYGAMVSSDEVTIDANEVAEVKSIYGESGGGHSYLNIIKNGVTNIIWTVQFQSSGAYGSQPLPTIAGPATLRLTTESGGSYSDTCFCTVKIEPESFPPDKTIIIPQNTPGANIIMEQSSDLVHWTNSVPGLYTNTAISSMFFRIRADRL